MHLSEHNLSPSYKAPSALVSALPSHSSPDSTLLLPHTGAWVAGVGAVTAAGFKALLKKSTLSLQTFFNFSPLTASAESFILLQKLLSKLLPARIIQHSFLC